MKAKDREQKNKNLFRKDTPLFFTISLVLLFSALVYWIFPHPSEGKKIVVETQKSNCIPEMKILRSKDYKFTHRILLANTKEENSQLSSLKQRINNFINEEKSYKAVNEVSVYYRSLNKGEWFEINDANTFIPASLIKVATLITILKQAERDPSLLDVQLHFEKHKDLGYEQNIKNFSLEEKQNYTIRELLFYMIAYSDNDATALILTKINRDFYDKLYKDLEITPPARNRQPGSEYSITVADYCKFFRVLYNSSYLKEDYSEFALELLTKSTYNEGLLKNMKTGFPVAHKFGERVVNNLHELHEVGIFYVDRKPYMLGVMTTGSDLNELSSILSHISDIAYEESGKVN